MENISGTPLSTAFARDMDVRGDGLSPASLPGGLGVLDLPLFETSRKNAHLVSVGIFLGRVSCNSKETGMAPFLPFPRGDGSAARNRSADCWHNEQMDASQVVLG